MKKLLKGVGVLPIPLSKEGDTRKATIEKLEELVEHYEIEFFEKLIEKAIKEFGTSPLYTNEPLFPILMIEGVIKINGMA